MLSLQNLLLTLLAIPALFCVDANSNEITNIIRKYESNRKFQGVVRVVRDSNLEHFSATGFANIEHQLPLRVNHKFLLGSLSKPFAATGILRLAEDKMLDINDFISQHIQTPAHWKGIRIHHLLSHTSGLQRWEFMDDESRSNIYYTLNEKLEIFSKLPLIDGHKLGKDFAYSNIGYNILALIIEKVSGKTYEKFLQEAFFNPLHIEDIGEYNRTKIINNLADGYVWQNKQVSKPCCFRYSHGAGSTYASAESLGKWFEKIISNQVLSPKGTELLFKPQVALNSSLAYGYGWFVGDWNGHRFIRHGGLTDGFHSELYYVENINLMIIILSNWDDYDSPFLFEMVKEIRDIYKK